MSVYIKGMEMPENCDDCPIANCRMDNGWLHYPDRPEDCPLIPVPDHGRLIDADALMDALPDDFRIPSAAAKVIERTIIPLSKGGGT